MRATSDNKDRTAGASGRRGFRCALLGMGALLALTGVNAFAQGNPPAISQSPTIDRDRLDRAGPAIPRTGPEVQLPSAPARVEVAAPVQVALTQVRYEGATLASETLDEATRPFVGSPLDRDMLQKLANAISAAYAKSDIAFYAVSIPAQSAAGGVLVVRVVEGRIVEYKLASESSSTPKRLIDAQVKRLMRDTPTHKSTIERTLSLLRDIPGQTVQANLRTTTTPGELALDLDVKRKQVDVTLNLNNRGVVNVTSGAQAQLAVSLNGLLREGDTTRLSGYVPFQPSRYQFYSASHATPVGSAGTTVGLSGAYVRTRTRDLGIKGDARQLGIVVAHPLIRSYKRNLTLTASFDGTNSTNYYLDTAFGGFRTRALRLGANWSSIGDTSGYGVSLSLSQGFNALGAREIEGYSTPSYRKANLQTTFVKQLSPSIAAKATVRGQYSSDRLPTTERVVLGGEGAGLAFRDGFLTADKAATGGAELSWRVLGGTTDPRGLTVFAYADGALAHSYARPLYGLPSRDYSLASAGGGVRITPIKGWTGSAQVAVPVKKAFAGISEKTRFFFSVSRTL
ncbi:MULTISPECIES: ShlB/FhaC/HecB family hemolysin secretion/activation protein [unclassified Novosphingobium]|uniref:ShlB/FhaC/HecB family hemolysin secretion/activation protein n=1 Tax=unclassified Novosphingobium TaxID=2644732 RepID=UPI00135A75CC|nr:MULTISPECIES: ShlB/FhaC/HecB family hemolysin secretion/activation protein [unclassified Novosphingobium]